MLSWYGLAERLLGKMGEYGINWMVWHKMYSDYIHIASVRVFVRHGLYYSVWNVLIKCWIDFWPSIFKFDEFESTALKIHVAKRVLWKLFGSKTKFIQLNNSCDSKISKCFLNGFKILIDVFFFRNKKPFGNKFHDFLMKFSMDLKPFHMKREKVDRQYL